MKKLNFLVTNKKKDLNTVKTSCLALKEKIFYYNRILTF